MLRYILKRILLMIPVLLGIVVIVFTLMYVGGGDPTISILGENVTPEAQAEIREELGLDDPGELPAGPAPRRPGGLLSLQASGDG